MLEHRQDHRDRRGRRWWSLVAGLLVTVLLLVVGCSVITGAGCVPTGESGSPDLADLDGIALTYLDTGGFGYLGLGGGQRLVVMEDGRALALRDDGERMVLTLSPGELEQLRGAMGPWQGDFGLVGPPPSDLPSHHLTFVDTDREVHEVDYGCGDPEGVMGATFDRLAALRERVLDEGTVDTGAPIQVTFSVDSNRSDDLHHVGAWPAGLTPPEVPDDSSTLTYRVYEGSRAARLRKLLVPPAEVVEATGAREVTVSLPDGTVVATWWSGVLPDIGGETVF